MIQKLRGSNEKGFTLIELMIVIAIIGILAAIAIPNFVSYRQRSYNSSAQSDLKNAMTTQEAYFVDNSIYANSIAKMTAAGFKQSSNVTFAVNGTASATGYTMTAFHTSGNTTWTVHGPESSMAKHGS
jgi:prepilin-type N-terminal cleavage/methylation domain-containing protein